MKRSNKVINTQDLEVKLFNKSYALITPDGNLGYFGLFLRDILDIIDDTSAVNPDDLKPQGQWIDTETFDCHKLPIYQCSVCKKEVADYHINLHKYCLHCGTKMDGKEN